MPSAIATETKQKTSDIPRGPSLAVKRCSCGGLVGPSGECEECRRKKLLQQTSTTPSSLSGLGNLQRKVNLPSGLFGSATLQNTRHEQEADRIASMVMNFSEGTKNSRKVKENAASGNLFPKSHQPSPASPSGSTALPPIVRRVLNSSGQSLDRSTSDFMEQRFGADFSQVRIHTDSDATRSARAVNAKAYAAGNHIVFDRDFYSPHSSQGRLLLAHELVHVLQRYPELADGALAITRLGQDELQRAVDPRLLAIAGLLIALLACGAPWQQYALSHYGSRSDKFRHCYVSCQMSRTCGGRLAQIAGIGKELRDRAVAAYCDFSDGSSEICEGGHGDFMDSVTDIIANQTCLSLETYELGPLARLWRSSCYDCCDAAWP